MTPSPFDLTGQVAIVTGGNRGLGFGIAAGLAGAGADVCIWGRDAARNADAASRLGEHGTRVHHVRCDVADADEVGEAFADTVSCLGHVDACFANAGLLPAPRDFVDLTLADWRSVMSVNVEGAFLTLRAAAGHMIERGAGGSLVGVASVAGLHGAARAQAYSASKAALVAMVRGCAVELARHGIRANTLLPGWSESPMTSELLASDGMQRKVLPRIPLRRWGRPEDLAGAAVYLAGPASTFQTGTELVIDGGYAVF